MKTSLTGLNRRTKTLLAVTGVVLLIAVGVYSVWTTQADLRLLVLRQVGRALPGSSIETCIACQASCNYNEPSDPVACCKAHCTNQNGCGVGYNCDP